MTTRRHSRGFSLIEVIIFIVVVSVGLVGILLVSTTVVRSSSDPMVRKQAIAVAESMLDEITLKEFSDPNGGTNGVTTCNLGAFALAADATNTNRSGWDDVCDYNTYQSVGGIRDIEGNLVLGLGAYTANVAVADLVVNGQTLKQITVTVSWAGDQVVLVGYRGNY